MTTFNPAKSRGRNKLLKCFKPSSVDDLDDGPYSYFPTTSIDLPYDDDDDDGECHGLRKSGHHRSIKDVFFKTSLVKKLRGKRCRQHSCESNGNSPPSKNKSHSTLLKRSSSYKTLYEPDEDNSRTSSNRSSSLFSSMSSSSLSSRSIDEPETINEPVFIDFKPPNTEKMVGEILIRNNVSKCVNYKSYYNNYLKYILFVCLVALIFGGKPFAVVVCTSTCLYFAPSRRP